VTNFSVFFGEATDAQARVYVEYTADVPTDATLSGTVTGPFCQYARTLPARLPLVAYPADKAGTLLSQSVVPDPCFWTPEMPFLYTVDIEVRRGDELHESDQRQFGIRPLGVRVRDLVFGGRRWVLRGVDKHSINGDSISRDIRTASSLEQLLRECHAARAALVVVEPDDEICELASRLGVLLVALVEGPLGDVHNSLRRLARWSAVGLAVLSDASAAATLDKRPALNLLVGQRIAAAMPAPLAPWADVAYVEITRTDELQLHDLRNACDALGNVPTLVCRRLPAAMSITEARAAGDRLQRDFAPLGDFAGYIV